MTTQCKKVLKYMKEYLKNLENKIEEQKKSIQNQEIICKSTKSKK